MESIILSDKVFKYNFLMTNKGQIVEIPVNSPLYSRTVPEFSSKKEALLWKSQVRAYSLFDGFLVGGHPGVEHFKLGQRKGINVGGKKQPLYVIQIDQENNRLFVGAGEDHPGLLINVISFAENLLHWNQEKTFTSDELENGIAVEIVSSVVPEKIPAMLYVFEEQIFLEVEKPTFMIIKENPIRIFYDQKLLTEIK